MNGNLPREVTRWWPWRPRTGGSRSSDPHLYRLMKQTGRFRGSSCRPGSRTVTAAPLVRAAGSQARARAVWAFAHGMVLLELDQRFPPDADLDAAWHAGIAAFQARLSRPGSQVLIDRSQCPLGGCCG